MTVSIKLTKEANGTILNAQTSIGKVFIVRKEIIKTNNDPIKLYMQQLIK